MADFALPTRNTRRLLLSMIVLGFIARVALSWFSLGSTDFATWQGFGRLINERGLYSAYAADPLLNHPPLPVLWSAAALQLATKWNVLFSFVFRLPAILADVGSAFVLYRIGQARSGTGLRAAAWMSWSLPAILIGAFHCNTDNICAFFALLSAHLLAGPVSPLLAGVTLAVAINVKIIPLLLVPLLVAACPDRRSLLRFAIGLTLGLTPIFIALVGAGRPMLENVFHYKSMMGQWGVMYFFMELSGNAYWSGAGIACVDWYYANGRFVLLAAVTLMSLAAVVFRRWSALELAAIGIGLFLILAPGFGAQYLVYAVPVMFAIDLRRAASYSLVAGLCLLVIYVGYWTGTVPMRSEFGIGLPPPASLFGLLAWGVLVAFVYRTIVSPATGRSS